MMVRKHHCLLLQSQFDSGVVPVFEFVEYNLLIESQAGRVALDLSDWR